MARQFLKFQTFKLFMFSFGENEGIIVKKKFSYEISKSLFIKEVVIYSTAYLKWASQGTQW